MQVNRFIYVNGCPRYVINERDFEDLIRGHMGDEAADLFRDIVGKAPVYSLRSRCQKLSAALGDALDSLQMAGEIAEEMDDLLEE